MLTETGTKYRNTEILNTQLDTGRVIKRKAAYVLMDERIDEIEKLN